MSTPARIALRNPDGTYKAVTVDCDGYPSHTGRTLSEYYTTVDRINWLMSYGAVSFLSRYITDDEMLNAAMNGENVIYQLSNIEDKKERKALHKTQLGMLKAYAKHPISERFGVKLVTSFMCRDEGEPYEIEEFENVLEVLRAPGKLGVPYTYYFDGERWWAHYTYGTHDPILLEDFEHLMKNYYDGE